MVRKRKIVEEDDEEEIEPKAKEIIDIDDNVETPRKYNTRSAKKSKQSLSINSQSDSFEMYFDTSIFDKEEGVEEESHSSKKSKKSKKKKKKEEDIEEIDEYAFETKKKKKKKTSENSSSKTMLQPKKQKLNFYSQSSVDTEGDHSQNQSESQSSSVVLSNSSTFDVPRTLRSKEEQLWICKYAPKHEVLFYTTFFALIRLIF